MTKMNIEEYRKLQQKRIASLKKSKIRTPQLAARYMAAQLRSMSPYDSGRMIASIKVNKNKVSLRGSNPRTGWPYVHWINDTPGIKGRTGTPGINLTSWGKKYVQIKGRTGTPGFFWIAQDKTRVYFREASLRALRASLRGEF